MKEILLNKFEELFGDAEGVNVYFAPGRVNLIGEHTDYNGGHVFPCALTIGTYAAVRKRKDSKLFFYSVNFADKGIVESDINAICPNEEAGWTNYPKGVIWAFSQRGMNVNSGMEFVVYGDIPDGAGLSSSASLEVLTGFVLRDLYGFMVSDTELALIGQFSENTFNGVNCGIMDQFASAMGKKDSAIFLNTSNLSFEYAPLILGDSVIVITNSNVKHSLAGSKYNMRRKECEFALRQLQKVIDIRTLADLDETEFENNKFAIADEICIKRARHAVYENRRTLKAVEALKNRDIETFGKLMNESHISLRDDYEVSCGEIDVLVEEAWKIPGVIGSRITGGGFGGCTVSIVKKNTVETFKERISKVYKLYMGKEASFYLVDVGNGPYKL